MLFAEKSSRAFFLQGLIHALPGLMYKVEDHFEDSKRQPLASFLHRCIRSIVGLYAGDYKKHQVAIDVFRCSSNSDTLYRAVTVEDSTVRTFANVRKGIYLRKHIIAAPRRDLASWLDDNVDFGRMHNDHRVSEGSSDRRLIIIERFMKVWEGRKTFIRMKFGRMSFDDFETTCSFSRHISIGAMINYETTRGLVFTPLLTFQARGEKYEYYEETYPLTMIGINNAPSLYSDLLEPLELDRPYYDPYINEWTPEQS